MDYPWEGEGRGGEGKGGEGGGKGDVRSKEGRGRGMVDQRRRDTGKRRGVRGRLAGRRGGKEKEGGTCNIGRGQGSGIHVRTCVENHYSACCHHM